MAAPRPGSFTLRLVLPTDPPTGPTPPPPTGPPSGPPTSTGVTPGALLAEARTAAVPALLGLAVALGVAVLVTVVVLLGFAIAGDSPSGIDDEFDNVTVLLFLPFQVLGLGLLGTLGLTESGVHASLYAPVYWVTGAFVVTTAVLARRGELRAAVPTTTLERVRSGAIVGLALGVLLLALMRLLAMRANGTLSHTASPTLFVGTTLLTLGALWAGRWSARGRWHRAVDLDLVVSMRLMWSVLVGWLVVAVPLAAILALIGEGPDAAVAVLAAGPTAAIYLLELGHLGALSGAGETFFVWSQSILLGVVLTLGALVSTLLVSVAWHRRRVRPAGADAWSWAVLPLAGLVGGLIAWLAGLVVIGGGVGGFGGQAVIAPAFWSMFVLAVWALAAEGLSRTVAPALSPSLPAPLARLLDHPRPLHEGDPTDQPGGERAEPRVRTPEERRRDRRLVLIGVGVVASLAVLAIGYRVVDSTFFGPEKQAEAYLDAVVDADLDKAQELAPFDYEPEGLAFAVSFGDEDTRTDLFTREIYEATQERITGYEILSTDVSGDRAELEVRLEGLSGEPTADLTLYRDGRSLGLFTDWVVGDAGLAQVGSSYGETDSIGVNGIMVQTDPEAEQWLLPGTYDVDPYADNPFLQADVDPVVVEPGAGYASIGVSSSAEPTEEFRAQLDDQVGAYLEECMASTELEPEGCPQSTYSFGDGVRKVEWTLTRAPDTSDLYLSGEFPETLYLSDGEAAVTYEADESYGFGPKDFQPQEDTSYLSLQVEVDVDGDELVVSFEP